MYPNKLGKAYKKSISHSNRGMDLEDLINKTNDYYLNKDIALIHKKDTPIGVVKVSYKNQKKIIDKAYFKEQSTLDYNGIYKGKYITFDAKVTAKKTAFPLSNIHQHQIEYIQKVIQHGGISFIILKINNKIFLIPGETLIEYIATNNRKSIAYDYINEFTYEIKEGLTPALDYIKILDQLYFKGE